MPAQRVPKIGDGMNERGLLAVRKLSIEERVADFNAFIEHYFNQVGKLPSMVRLKAEFPKAGEAKLKADLRIAAVMLEAKGYGIAQRQYLSPEQIAVANSMLNLADRRSNTKKLNDFGISSAVYANWKKDPAYINYIRQRSEAMLGEAVPDVHLALIESATNGDIAAIKLFYEITGRHTPGSQQNVNVQSVLLSVIESVQRHVKDPVVLQAIAGDLQIETGERTISGELDNKA